jgi:hypothetical protein
VSDELGTTDVGIELALDIRREIEARQEEADRLRCRAIERAQLEADLAGRRFMRVDPNNRLVADTLEADWNDKLRALEHFHLSCSVSGAKKEAFAVCDGN